MICLSHRTRFAAGLFVACSVLLSASGAYGESNAQKRIDASYVWRPTREALLALKEAMSMGNVTKQALLKIMQNDNASGASLAFAGSFSSEAAYLGAIDLPDPGGFTVGKVIYPFRKNAAKTYVILNGQPRIIDVTNPKFLNHIDIALSKAFKALWGSTMKAECLWSEPRDYNLQPGMYRNVESNDVQVAYPIKDLGNGKVIGFAYVVFQFAGRRWGFSDTRLDMITDAANNYLWPSVESR